MSNDKISYEDDSTELIEDLTYICKKITSALKQKVSGEDKYEYSFWKQDEDIVSIVSKVTNTVAKLNTIAKKNSKKHNSKTKILNKNDLQLIIDFCNTEITKNTND